jgi:hypothetical protein
MIEAPDAPDGAVDISDEVEALKHELHDVLSGRHMAVISLALGCALGESLDTEDTLRAVVSAIASSAAQVFCQINYSSLEEGTVH